MPETRNIELDWEGMQEQVINTGMEIMNTDERWFSMTIQINETTEMEITRGWAEYKNLPTLKMELREKVDDEKQEIADFYVTRDKENSSWGVGHRLVAPEYRGQGIGTEMLGLFEDVIQEYADETDTSQDVNIATGQIGVLNFSMRNGYLPESKEDIERIKRIYEGGDDLVVVESRGYEYDGGWLPGTVYERGTLEENYLDIASWGGGDVESARKKLEEIEWDGSRVDEVMHRDPEEAAARAFKINLTKEIVPK